LKKTEEKIENYQDLKRELKRLWKCKEVVLVPIVIGALRTDSKRFRFVRFYALQKKSLFDS